MNDMQEQNAPASLADLVPPETMQKAEEDLGASEPEGNQQDTAESASGTQDIDQSEQKPADPEGGEKTDGALDPKVYDEIKEIEGYDPEKVRDLLDNPHVGKIKEIAAKHGLPPEAFKEIVEAGIAMLAEDMSVDVEEEMRKLGSRAHERVAAAATLVRQAVGIDHPMAQVVLSSAEGIELIERLVARMQPAGVTGRRGTAPMSASDIRNRISNLLNSDDYWQNAEKRAEVERLTALMIQMR